MYYVFFNDKLVAEFSNIKKAIKHSKNYDCKQICIVFIPQ